MNTKAIALVVVYFADIYSGLGKFLIREHLIFSNVLFDSPFEMIYYRRSRLSDLIFVKIYFHAHQSDYYLVGLHKRSVGFERTSVLASHRCSHVDILPLWVFYNQTNENEFNYIHRLKVYHRACYIIGLTCFYDQFYICICDNDTGVQCFLLDHTASNCSSTSEYCLNQGVCQRSSLSSSNPSFACACPTCFYGDLCQFTTTQYSVTLDMLELSWSVFLAVTLIVIIGMSINFLSISVFLQRSVRNIGCGLYLLALSIIGQIGLFLFFVKLLYLFGKWHSHQFLCIGFELILTVLLSVFDWLTACVTIERTMNISKGVMFNREASVRAAKYVIALLLVFNGMTNIHETFYRRLINDPRGIGHQWCVLDFSANNVWISRYEKVTNIAHIIEPFLINLMSVFAFLVRIHQRRSVTIALPTTTKHHNDDPSFFRIVRRYKYCLISPMMLLCFGLPRLVFTFAFVCIESSWQKQVYILSYLLSVLPMAMTFFIFILPSPEYLIQLKKRCLIKFSIELFRRSLHKTK